MTRMNRSLGTGCFLVAGRAGPSQALETASMGALLQQDETPLRVSYSLHTMLNFNHNQWTGYYGYPTYTVEASLGEAAA